MTSSSDSPPESQSASVAERTHVAGRYRLVRPIGHGGMADVFLAVDETSDERVAVKLLRRRLIKKKRGLQQFTEEVAATRRAKHENLVALRDSGIDGDQPFLVMEHVDGPSLATWVTRQGRVETAIALELFRQVGRGLEAMHREGVIHRDVNPGNILVELDDGVPRRALISDLGLARLASVRGITRTCTAVGAPAFMAPELVVGDDVDPRTDIYGWGMALFFAVAGEPPFVGPVQHVMMHQLRSPTPPPSWLAEGASLTIDRVLLSAVRKNPANRYQTVADAVADVESLLRDEPDAVKGAPLVGDPDEYVPQNPAARDWMAAFDWRS